MRVWPALLVVTVVIWPALAAQQDLSRTVASDWPMYNRDLAGTRYSPLKQITTANVSRLARARGRTRSGATRLPDRSRAALNSQDRKSTRLNSSHVRISYAVFCLRTQITARCTS